MFLITFQMASYLQETTVGQIVRLITRNKVFSYPEEDPNFQIPWQKVETTEKEKEAEVDAHGGDSSSSHSSDDSVAQHDPSTTAAQQEPVRSVRSVRTRSDAGLEAGLSTVATAKSSARDFGIVTTRTKTREQTSQFTAERFEVEQQEATERMQSTIIAPQTTADGFTLID